MSLFDELKRRNVLRVAIAYLASAWFLIEVADTILPRLGFSDHAVTNTIIVLAIGFIPILVLSWFFEWTPEGLRRDSEAGSVSVIATRTNRSFDAIIIVVLVFAIGFFAFDKFVLDPTRDSLEIEAATKQGRADAVLGSYGDNSIVVLAFRDMSPAHDQEYFSDGIAEEILNVLAKIRNLRVISRSSAFSFKGTGMTLPEIAKKLNVSYVLEGSVRKSGDKIRITAQLIDARTDAHIWSETYDRKLDDVFLIQDEISENIVEQLKMSIFGRLRGATQIDSAAYELFLEARFILNAENRERFREAQALLNEVLVLEPDYIPALNLLARLYYRIPKSEGMSGEQNVEEIHLLAERVIELEPDGMSSLLWQGWFAYRDHDYQAAARFYEKALRVDPNDVNLLRVVVVLLVEIGRAEEAVTVGIRLAHRDPACRVCVGNLAWAYSQVGKYEEAAQTLESNLVWNKPQVGLFWSLGAEWLLAGFPEKALASFEKEIDEVSREAGIILVLPDLGRMEDFDVRFARLRTNKTEPETIARIYAWIGNSDKAFEWLDKAIELHGARVVGWIDTGLYQKLKSDPRWGALREKYGYSDQAMEAIEFSLNVPSGASDNVIRRIQTPSDN
jgi:adenylate cyclase